MERPTAVERLAGLILDNESRAAQAARLLHDQAGQALTAAGFYLQAASNDGESSAALRECLDAALENIRSACNTLQANIVERTGLSLAIKMLADDLRACTGIDVQLQLNPVGGLSPAAGHAIYRVVELALENVQRHAGTNRAEVRLETCGTGFRCEIQDNGCGFDVGAVLARPSGTGLALMAAYARQQRLHFQLDSARSQGTIVKIETF